jgi:parvulin-like peptidyl-prolyl isomerase
MKPSRLLLAILSVLTAVSVRGEILERVIVKVNGLIVTQSEFENRQIAAVQQAHIAPDKIEAFLRENNARLLQDAIEDLLLVDRARALDLRLKAEYLNEVIENIKKENNLASDQALQEQLRREGMSLDDLKRNIEHSILKRQVLSRELEPKAQITEADALAYYEAHREEFSHPATVHLQEILIAGTDAAARTRAQQTVTRARGGSEFTALARAESAAPSKNAGGDLGTLSRGEMNPELEKVAFTIPAGSVSDPIATADGFRILRVAERTDAGATPFEAVKKDLQKRLSNERWEKIYKEYLEGLRKNALVDLKVREVPLQVDVPTTPTLREPPSGQAGAATESDQEFTTSGADKPERVAPPTAPDAPKPSPPPL